MCAPEHSVCVPERRSEKGIYICDSSERQEAFICTTTMRSASMQIICDIATHKFILPAKGHTCHDRSVVLHIKCCVRAATMSGSSSRQRQSVRHGLTKIQNVTNPVVVLNLNTTNSNHKKHLR